ncbi:hypothetical protein [Stetteria hydrogenophila]
MALCSVCRRREAFYLRTYSGQRLCAACLRRTLERALRRSISEAGGLPPRSRVVVPVSFTSPHLSLALLDVAVRVERRFGSEVVGVVPREVEVEPEGASLPGEQGLSRLVRVSVPPPEEATLSECIRFDSAWSARVAESLGGNAVLLPLTLTDRVLAMLDSLILGEAWLASESLLSRSVGGVRVIHAFGTIEGEAVAAYAARMEVRAWSPCRVASPSKKVLYSVAYRRPELEYSALKTISRLAQLAGGFGVCRYCGGFTAGGGASVCPVCERLRPAERVRL